MDCYLDEEFDPYQCQHQKMGCCLGVEFPDEVALHLEWDHPQREPQGQPEQPRLEPRIERLQAALLESVQLLVEQPQCQLRQISSWTLEWEQQDLPLRELRLPLVQRQPLLFSLQPF